MRLVRQLRRELGTEHGTVQRVAGQLGYGVETVRKWVKSADIDEGVKPGRSSHAVGLTHGMDGQPPSRNQDGNRYCMRTPGPSAHQVGSHNVAHINYWYP